MMKLKSSSWFCAILLLVPVTATLCGQVLHLSTEFRRPDPFGNIVAADWNRDTSKSGYLPEKEPLRLETARGGYVSFQLVPVLRDEGDYTLHCTFADIGKSVQVDLYKAWFHRLKDSGAYIPDALIPISNPYSGRMPDPENKIPNQTAQSFWIDLYVPEASKPGIYKGLAILQSGRKRLKREIFLTIRETIVPSADALVVDHNTYGTGWMGDLYPKMRAAAGSQFYSSDALFRLIHAYHRLFYEHRGTFHQLGYGHAGKVGPEFAPALAGRGKSKRIAAWDLFDRHYAPLLDGSAFTGSRRGPAPIPFVYLPINPEWPASFLAWGEPGYEEEFTRIVAEMERHFRDKGWTQTHFEMFFNFKKRYKGFPWDGDETRFPKDDAFFLEMDRLLKRSVPQNSPVRFVFRHDASWRLEEQFRTLAGAVNFWVCSRGILSYLPKSVETAKKRGDILWIYSGPPSMQKPASAILENPLLAWVWGLDGYIHWQTVTPSQDPWFASDGESICLAYPGERFGREEPVPSIRLKIQRNFVQDLALMKVLEKSHSKEWVRSQVTRQIDGKPAAEWWTPRPAMADIPPQDWTNASIAEGIDPAFQKYKDWPSGYWAAIRHQIFQQLEGDMR